MFFLENEAPFFSIRSRSCFFAPDSNSERAKSSVFQMTTAGFQVAPLPPAPWEQNTHRHRSRRRTTMAAAPPGSAFSVRSGFSGPKSCAFRRMRHRSPSPTPPHFERTAFSRQVRRWRTVADSGDGRRRPSAADDRPSSAVGGPEAVPSAAMAWGGLHWRPSTPKAQLSPATCRTGPPPPTEGVGWGGGGVGEVAGVGEMHGGGTTPRREDRRRDDRRQVRRRSPRPPPSGCRRSPPQAPATASVHARPLPCPPPAMAVRRIIQGRGGGGRISCRRVDRGRASTNCGSLPPQRPSPAAASTRHRRRPRSPTTPSAAGHGSWPDHPRPGRQREDQLQEG